MPRPQLRNLTLRFGTNRVCDLAPPLPKQAIPLPRPTHYIKTYINTTKEINLHRQNRTLHTRYFTMTYLVVVRGLTNYFFSIQILIFTIYLTFNYTYSNYYTTLLVRYHGERKTMTTPWPIRKTRNVKLTTTTLQLNRD